MAKTEECNNCIYYKNGAYGMKCSYYGRVPKFDDTECSHFNDKIVEKATEEKISVKHEESTRSYEEEHVGPILSYLKSHWWIVLIPILLLIHAIELETGFSTPSSTGHGKTVFYMAILFPGEAFISIEWLLICIGINFVIAYYYYRMMIATNAYKSRFSTIYAKGRNAFMDIFISQLVISVCGIIDIILYEFGHKGETLAFIDFVVMTVLIINIFTVGIQLRRYNMKSLGVWMIVYGIVWSLQWVDSIIEMLTDSSFIEGFLVFIISVFEMIVAFVFHFRIKYELAPTLKEMDTDIELNQQN